MSPLKLAVAEAVAVSVFVAVAEAVIRGPICY